MNMKIEGNVFTGYYDVINLSANDKFLIYHKVKFIDRMPKADDPCELCMTNLETGKEIKFGTTTAWNWQQGSRLQWLGPNYNRSISYNKFKDGKLCGII